jgi:hypothetical protein
MPDPTLTLTIPLQLYRQLEQFAQRSKRTVEAAVLEILTVAVPVSAELPADLEEAISPLSSLDDESLWRAARSRLAAEDAARMEELHHKREQEGLNEAESQVLAGLVRQYERSMLVRAQAAALLRQRGHDLSGLLAAS